MMRFQRALVAVVAAIAFCVAFESMPVANGQGLYLSGVGTVNRSMGGAATAAPIDAIGALHWNSASIAALPNEIAFGAELLAADVDLSSTAGPGTDGKAGVAVVPSIGWVHRLADPRFTIGLGLAGVAGFKNIQPAGNALLGGDPAYGAAEFLQLTPTLAYAVTDRLSIGIAPTVTIGELGFDPVGPSAITPTPTLGQGNRAHWGLGLQAGVYYQARNDFQLGFQFRSPQWMETFSFHVPPASDPSGVVDFKLDLPMILSIGTAYSGIEDWTFAADFRYFAYADADGFDDLGWGNIFAAAFGMQKVCTDRLTVRTGINFNQPPIRESDVGLNILFPLIQKYNVACGGSLQLTDNARLDASYVYLGRNSVSGPVGPVRVTNEVQAHSLIAGVTVNY